MNLGEIWAERARLVEEALASALPPAEAAPTLLHQAMHFATLGGGKRLRGFLALAAAEALGRPVEPVLPAACAVEMIHAYSLIHDDLPCMDDDDWRRGRPSTHRVYGEAIALLAGDALLTEAFAVLGEAGRRSGTPAEKLLAAVAELAVSAGSRGMAGGQADDLLGEGRAQALESLESIHRRKTGALIRAAVRLGAILSGAGREQLAALTAYGEALGLAFQITDDLLDVEGEAEKTGKPVRRDAVQGKATYPGFLGIPEAKRRARVAVADAIAALAPFGEQGRVLADLAEFILKRDH